MGMMSINLVILLFLVIAAWAYLLYEGFRNEKKEKDHDKDKE